jgi:hypothetical protein
LSARAPTPTPIAATSPAALTTVVASSAPEGGRLRRPSGSGGGVLGAALAGFGASAAAVGDDFVSAAAVCDRFVAPDRARPIRAGRVLGRAARTPSWAAFGVRLLADLSDKP